MPIEIDHRVKGDIVEIPVEEFERLEATIEFLENERLQEGILQSLEQYREGKSRSWDEVREDL